MPEPTSLPDVSPRSSSAICLLIGVFGFLFLTQPAFILPGDPVAIRLSTESWINSGTFNVPPEIAQEFGDRGQYFHEHPTSGEWQPKYGFANTLAYVPPLILERFVYKELQSEYQASYDHQTRRCFVLNLFNISIAVLLTYWLYELATRLSLSRGVATISIALILFTTYVWYYLRAQSSEIMQLAAFTGLCAFMGRLDEQRPQTALLSTLSILGITCFLCLMKLAYVLIMPLVLIWGWHSAADRHDVPKSRIRRAVLFAGLVLTAVVVLAVNEARFGSPWDTGYSQWEKEKNLFSYEWRQAVAGLLVDARASVILHFPWVIVGLVGARWIPGNSVRWWSFAIASLATQLAVVVNFVNWRGEWCYGPRYLLFALPVVALPMGIVLAVLLRGRNGASPVALVLVLVPAMWSFWNQFTVNRYEGFLTQRIDGVYSTLRTNPMQTGFASESSWDILRHARAFVSRGEIPQELVGIDPGLYPRISAAIRPMMGINWYWSRLLFGTPSNERSAESQGIRPVTQYPVMRLRVECHVGYGKFGAKADREVSEVEIPKTVLVIT